MTVMSWRTGRWFVRPRIHRGRKVTPLSMQALWIGWLRFAIAVAWR